jgi:hypothetical protein
VFEKRRTPFDRFLHIRARGVDELADAAENRPGKIAGPGDIGVDARILLWHVWSMEKHAGFINADSPWLSAAILPPFVQAVQTHAENFRWTWTFPAFFADGRMYASLFLRIHHVMIGQ